MGLRCQGCLCLHIPLARHLSRPPSLVPVYPSGSPVVRPSVFSSTQSFTCLGTLGPREAPRGKKQKSFDGFTEAGARRGVGNSVGNFTWKLVLEKRWDMGGSQKKVNTGFSGLSLTLTSSLQYPSTLSSPILPALCVQLKCQLF